MPLLELHAVVKDYKGLRPLRIQSLAVGPGEVVALAGPDAAAAAVLTDLITGTALPDAGEVQVEGRRTSDVSSPDQWLSFLEHFALVNDRVVLLDGLSVAQNLAVPLTLDLDPLAADVRDRVLQLAEEAGLRPDALDAPLVSSSPLVRARVRLGRALAHDPRILVAEHPTLGLDAGQAAGLGADVARISRARHLATLVVSSDTAFVRRAASRALTLRAATGELVTSSGWRWFARR